MMSLSQKLFLFFLLLFPLLHASIPTKCASSNWDAPRCGRFRERIKFPFCGHPGFNLHCNHLNETILELPMSGTFIVRNINYEKQQITIDDPEDCIVKRLLTFNISGSPFSYPQNVYYYTFLTCPKEVGIIETRYPFIGCLSNSTSTFFATSDLTLAASMLPSCQIVKSVGVPLSFMYEEKGLSYILKYASLLLEWNSPDCRGCEQKFERCGFKNKASLEVKCFSQKTSSTDPLSPIEVLIIVLCAIGGITMTCLAILIYKSKRQNAAIAAQQPREVVIARGLDQSTIESYKTVELGESRRLPGANGMVCPICLSEYASKEIVRCIPECDHCFHVECIDAWLRIHGLCPICRNSSRS